LEIGASGAQFFQEFFAALNFLWFLSFFQEKERDTHSIDDDAYRAMKSSIDCEK